MKSKSKRKKVIISILLIVIVLQAVIFIGPLDGIKGDEVEHNLGKLSSFITWELENEKIFSQHFVPSYGYLNHIKFTALQVGEDLPGELHIQILNQNEKELWKKVLAIKKLKNGDWNTIKVDCKVPMQEECMINFWTEGAEQSVSFLLINSSFDLEENRAVYYDRKEIPGGMPISYIYSLSYSKMGRIILCSLISCIGIFLLLLINLEKMREKCVLIFKEEYDIGMLPFIIGVFAVTFIAIYSHLYLITKVPYGLNIDEMGMGYDAWCMANFGVDRYLKSFPVYLINFDGGQSVLYMYLTAILIKVFGYSEMILRMPALLNFIICVWFGGKIVYQKWSKRKIVLLFYSLISIMPIFTMLTRIGLDCNLMLGTATVFLYFLLKAIDYPTKINFVVAGLMAGIVLYSYVISYIVLPVFLIIVLGLLLWTKKINVKSIICFCIPLGILAFPLILVQIINMFDLPEMMIGKITITKLPVYRESEVSFANFFLNAYKSITYVFMNDMWYYNSLPEFKTMYWFSVPFGIIGIVNSMLNLLKSIKKHEYHKFDLLLLWFFVTIFTGGLLNGAMGPCCYKINGIYFVTLFFVIEGLVCVHGMLKNEMWYRVCTIILTLAYSVSFLSFTEYYYGEYTEKTYPSFFFNTTFKEAIEQYQVIKDKAKDRKVVIESDKGENIVFFCGSVLPSPYDFEYSNSKSEYQEYIFAERNNMQIDEQQIYIVEEYDRDFAIDLEKNGFIVQKIGTRFLCYHE